MKLIIGLGNPGKKYQETKHNVGFWALDAFAKREGLSFSEKKCEALIGRGRRRVSGGSVDFILGKPQTFMNRSGESALGLLRAFEISFSDLIVVYDDLDLECGRIRLRKKGRSGGHRGVASIIESVGSEHFLRVKIGIGRDPRQDPSDYVLTPFPPDKHKAVMESIEKAVEAFPLLLEDKVTEAMNRLHSVEPQG
ncbi:MAG TPA: aminoacyl-tRNA hydrolase [Candidatus Manganitrophaceae bacterium]